MIWLWGMLLRISTIVVDDIAVGDVSKGICTIVVDDMAVGDVAKGIYHWCG